MLIAVMGMFAMSACGDDDDDVKPGNLPAGVENAMKVQFPNAQNVKWEKKGAYVTHVWRKRRGLRTMPNWR